MNWLTNALLRVQRKTGIALIVVLVGIVFAYHLGSGVVLDEVTGRPLEGAYVVARWSARGITPVRSSDVCFKVVSTKTDQAGRFMLWPISWNFNPLYWFRSRDVRFYFRGYVLSEPSILFPLLVSMKPEPALDITRIESILTVAWRLGCGPHAQQKQFLLPVYEAMASEAKEIADRTGEPGFARSVQRYVDRVTGRNSEQ